MPGSLRHDRVIYIRQSLATEAWSGSQRTRIVTETLTKLDIVAIVMVGHGCRDGMRLGIEVINSLFGPCGNTDDPESR